MATNDFLPFSVGSGANVLSQAAYAALAALGPGFSSGVAQSAACNKVWRQSTIMASVVAQLIVANTGQNATDDGTTATLLANLQAAVSGRLLGVTVISSSGTFTPNPLATRTKVRLSGGGAAGGGTQATGASTCSVGSGGGAGAYAEVVILSKITGTVACTVGSGGTGVSGGTGGTGGATSFGSFASCPGGIGGLASSPTAPPFFGAGNANSAAPTLSGATAILTYAGAIGGGAFAFAANSLSGGRGSSNAMGVAAAPPLGFGTGGNGSVAGNSAAASAGSAGTAGVLIVEEYA